LRGFPGSDGCSNRARKTTPSRTAPFGSAHAAVQGHQVSPEDSSLQGLAWVLFVFFTIALFAFVLVRIFEHRRPKGSPLQNDSEGTNA
jgi:hypothetical protein